MGSPGGGKGKGVVPCLGGFFVVAVVDFVVPELGQPVSVNSRITAYGLGVGMGIGLGVGLEKRCIPVRNAESS
jgi:hypothetical protein